MRNSERGRSAPQRGTITVRDPLARQPGARSRFAWRHPDAYLSVFGVSGLLLSIGLLWAFFAIAEDVPEKGRMDQFDLSVVTWLQTHGSERGETLFSAISFIGSSGLAVVVVVVGIVFLKRRDWRRLILLGATTAGAVALNYALKDIYQRSRPTFASEFVPGASWSFPSGHAMDSLVSFGILAYLLLEFVPDRATRRWIVGAAIALILLIGFSRIYLGVHFPSDVLGGFIAGSVWLQVCISGYRFAERRRVGSSPRTG